jgi:hypothetical protein
MTLSSLSAKEAAEQVGLTKQGLIKAIRQGKISAVKDHNGEWQIEPVELFRVYSPVDAVRGGGNDHQPSETGIQRVPQEEPGQLANLQREMTLLRELVATKNEVIFDLRRRLDDEFDERQKLTALLSASLVQPAAPKGFWRRLLG